MSVTNQLQIILVISFILGIAAHKMIILPYETIEDIKVKVEHQDEKTPYNIDDICAIGMDRFVQIKHRYQNSIDTWKYDVVLLTDDTTSIGVYNGLTHDFIDYCNPPEVKQHGK